MKKFIAVLAVTVLFAGAVYAPAYANQGQSQSDNGSANTCDKVGFPEENKRESSGGNNSVSGVWGSADWTGNDAKTLTVTVNEGWKVDICIKAGGSPNHGIHLFEEVTSDVNSLPEDSELPHGISHVSWMNPVPPTDDEEEDDEKPEDENDERPEDEEDEGQVLGQSTEDQQVVAPVGAVDAGAGGSQAGLGALLGLAVSGMVAAAGLTHRKWAQLFSRA